jgi:16S rRNA (cytosine1402-N4)-methyltransferase
VSSHHFDDETRGFSFRFDAPLDMRMNNRAGKTAADILNDYTEEQLADIFYLYGELKDSRRLAKMIAKYRQNQRLETTQNLMDALGVQSTATNGQWKKDMAKAFQALRIEVNHEMDALREMLNGATNLLKEGGRLSVITYHSLEDRIVKNNFRTNENPCTCPSDFPVCVCGQKSKGKVITRKPILPSDKELEENSRSKSAKLRVFERHIAE